LRSCSSEGRAGRRGVESDMLISFR